MLGGLGRSSRAILSCADGGRLRVLTCVVAAMAGFLITVVCFYPGYMWLDSNNQYLQARNAGYSDWHPPLMSFVWRRFYLLYPGSTSMLMFHNLMFWSGLGLLTYLTRLRTGLTPAAILAVGFFPPLFVALGIIMKDTGMIAALLLAYACFAWAYLRASRIGFLLGLASLVYGCGVRHNTATVLVPLSVLGGYAACRLLPFTAGRERLARLGLAAALVVGVLVLNWQVSRYLTQGQTLYSSQSILLDDLVAVSIANERIMLPAYIQAQAPGITVDDLRRMYSPNNVAGIFWVDTNPHFSERISSADYQELVRAWLTTVPTHLDAYARHRLDVFQRLFGLGTSEVCGPYFSGPVEGVANVLGFTPAGRALNDWVMAQLEPIKNGILFRGWFYLALSTTLTVWLLLVRREQRLFVAVLGLSGLCYALAYLPTAPACPFRYHWWTVLVTLLLPLVALLPRARAQSTP